MTLDQILLDYLYLAAFLVVGALAFFLVLLPIGWLGARGLGRLTGEDRSVRRIAERLGGEVVFSLMAGEKIRLDDGTTIETWLDLEGDAERTVHIAMPAPGMGYWQTRVGKLQSHIDQDLMDRLYDVAPGASLQSGSLQHGDEDELTLSYDDARDADIPIMVACMSDIVARHGRPA